MQAVASCENIRYTQSVGNDRHRKFLEGKSMNFAPAIQAPTTLVRGSLSDMAARQNVSLAESFLSADAIVLADISDSMLDLDAGRHADGTAMSRHQRAAQELASLQESLPGKVVVVAFASQPRFCPGGSLPVPNGTTNLTEALKFVAVADGTVDFIVISDGEPDNEESALEVASKFESKISTVYVGPEGGAGREFLKKLAQKSGGVHEVAQGALRLSNTMKQLILPQGRM